MPQLDFSSYSSQIFWLLVAFTIIYLYFKLHLVPKLDGIYRQRFEKTVGTEADADSIDKVVTELRQQINETKISAQQQINQIMQDAETTATNYREKVLQTTDEQLKHRLKVAKANQQQLKLDLEQQLIENAISIAAQVLSKVSQTKVTKTDRTKLEKTINIAKSGFNFINK